ncbi:MAG TPA: ABC transporter ATP-binding protein [Gemmatimonadales bacterium]|nr:ABC transporter ATP-binding protein [Gemmatimonadales bacterium]
MPNRSTLSLHSGISPAAARALARRSLEFVRPHRAALLGVLVLALLLSSLSALDPLVMKYLFDQLGRAPDTPRFGALIAALLMLEVGRAWLSAWLGVLSWDVRLAVEYRVRESVTAKLNALPIAFHQREGVGGTMNRVNQAVTGYVTAFSDIGFNLLPTLLYLVIALVAMTRLDWRLSLAVVAFTPVPALIGARAAPEQTRRERRLVERWTSIYGRLNEVLAGIVTVKSFAMEEAEQRRFLTGVREGLDIVRQGVRTDNRNGAFRSLAGTLARLAAIAIGGMLVWQGEITLGTLVAFLGYIGGLFGPVQNLTNTYQTLRKASVSLETIYDILDAEDALADEPGAGEAPPLRGEVRFEQVSFGYREGTPVLRDIDLHVRPGEMVALVGPSGSGKTTLLNLLQRLYHPTAGRILVDGADIRRLTQKSLRRQIGVVLQDAHLFNDTVRANIAYGRPEATEREIEAAARLAHAHEFITALPDGYDTMVRERGTRLSGGQRQRIAIARALLKDPAILMLDEPTSALDAESEAAIQEGLRLLRRGRTALIVAHRLSTVMDADRIVVICDGRVAETGTHDELLRLHGYYAAMVARQAKGFLGTTTAPNAAA